MPIKILMPSLSPTMEEGTLVKWLVKEGDMVEPGDILAEIETDKAVMEFEAVDAGVIKKILVPENSEGVKINAEIALLLEDGEELDGAATPSPPLSATAPPLSTAPPPSATAPPPPLSASQISSPRPLPSLPKTSAGRVFASPLARRLAHETGLDLSTIKGSGPNGRIIKADIEAAEHAPRAVQSISTPAAGLERDGPSTRVELDTMRKTVAARLSEAKQTIPHFYLRRSARLDNLLNMRAEINPALQERGIKISINDFIIKAVAMALQDIPEANSIWGGDHILSFTHSNIAVAVAVEGGLYTPLIRHAEDKSLSTIAHEIKDLAGRAREAKLAPHEYQGGSFTISNLGMYGIENFDAIINPPHSAILAVGAGLRQPIVQSDGTLGGATLISLTLSLDHRVIDGVVGAKLLEAIIAYIESPARALI